MTHRLATNDAKNYCNRTLIVKVIVENVVTCFFWDTVYIRSTACSDIYETDRPDGRDSRTVLHDFSAHTLASHSVATSPAPSNNTSNLNYLITYLLTCCQSQT